jgi:SAM-dependent methyltransferase
MSHEAVNRTTGGDAERIIPGTEHWDAGFEDHVQRYEFVSRFLPRGGAVLDAGCGVGYGSAYLLDRGAARVTAVDISSEAVTLARQHFDRGGITWLVDDCHTLEHAARQGPFDVISNLENIEHLERPDRFLSRAARMLSPQGVLVTSTPNRLLLNRLRGVDSDAPSENPYHVREYDEQEFRALLAPHFEDVQIHYQRLTLPGRARLRLAALGARLGVAPVVHYARRWWMKRQRMAEGTARARKQRWEIGDRSGSEFSAWAFLAVCRRPRPAHEPSSPRT